MRARDSSGNLSALSGVRSVTHAAAAAPLSRTVSRTATLKAWTTASGSVGTRQSAVHSGGFAAEGNTTAGATFAKETLPATYNDAYARVAFNVNSQASQVTLLRLRDTPRATAATST